MIVLLMHIENNMFECLVALITIYGIRGWSLFMEGGSVLVGDGHDSHNTLLGGGSQKHQPVLGGGS